MILRPYQQDALDAILASHGEHRSALVVMPTGTGKTVLFASLIKARRDHGRTLVVAHREELIRQAADKIARVTGEEPEIEMGDERADLHFFRKANVVVSSIQTQTAINAGKMRMERFRPNEFSDLIIDEAHRAAAPTYRTLIDYYTINKDLRVLGVTATPDRADEKALGEVFDTVAFDYEILDAIRDGWLVPVTQRSVQVDDLDFSNIRTTAGDLNGGDLAEIMEDERILHEVARPTLELAKWRKTLIFTASVKAADRLAEILNRYRPNSARWVCGATDKDERRQILGDYSAGRFQFLVNVDVFTEGFDEPGIEVVALARPTKSRAKFAQMIGRGTRPLPGVVDGVDAALARRAAIASSAKPGVEVIDFEGNCGRHKLVSCADILGGKYADEVVERAKAEAKKKGAAADIEQELEDAEKAIRDEKQASRRNLVQANVKYHTRTIDAFDIFDIEPARERAWDRDRAPSEKMIAFLDKAGVPTKGLSFTQAKQLIGEVINRRDAGRCTYKQAKVLQKYGYSPESSYQEAREVIDAIAANGWRRPEEAKA